MIRPVTPDDAAAIAAIYNHYVATTTISFEEQAVGADEMAQRVRDVTASLPWLVHEEAGRVTGYAYATKWRVRSAYRFAVLKIAKDDRSDGEESEVEDNNSNNHDGKAAAQLEKEHNSAIVNGVSFADAAANGKVKATSAGKATKKSSR